MDKTVRETTFEEAKADEYRYWQPVSDSERMAAWEHVKAGYRSKGYTTMDKDFKDLLPLLDLYEAESVEL